MNIEQTSQPGNANQIAIWFRVCDQTAVEQPLRRSTLPATRRLRVAQNFDDRRRDILCTLVQRFVFAQGLIERLTKFGCQLLLAIRLIDKPKMHRRLDKAFLD
jgi:hypothetical protein